MIRILCLWALLSLCSCTTLHRVDHAKPVRRVFDRPGLELMWLPLLDPSEFSGPRPGTFPKARHGVLINELGEIVDRLDRDVMYDSIGFGDDTAVFAESIDKHGFRHIYSRDEHLRLKGITALQAIGQGCFRYKQPSGQPPFLSLSLLTKHDEPDPAVWQYLDSCLQYSQSPDGHLEAPYEFITHTHVGGLDIVYNRRSGRYHTADQNGKVSACDFEFYDSRQDSFEVDLGLIPVIYRLIPFENRLYDPAADQFVALATYGMLIGSSPKAFVLSTADGYMVYDHELHVVGLVPSGLKVHTVMRSGFIIAEPKNGYWAPIFHPQVFDTSLKPIDLGATQRFDSIDRGRCVFARAGDMDTPLLVLDESLELLFKAPACMTGIQSLGESGFVMLDRSQQSTTYVLYDRQGRERKRFPVLDLLAAGVD